MEVGLFLTGCITFPMLYILSVNCLPLILPGRSKGFYLAISTRVVSLLQAVCAACVGLHVVVTCEDIMKDRYPSINYYAWFGFSYFYYDLGAMFLEAREAHSKERFLTICKIFLSKKYLLVLHHVFLPLFGFPIIVFYRRGIGDFFVGCVYMAEMSTPFLCAKAIMSQLEWQTSKLYKVNGLLLVISFFFARIFLFPFMYWSYARYSDLSVWRVLFRIPMHCNLSCLCLLSLQMVWFAAIVKKVVKFLNSGKHLKSSVPVLCANGGTTLYPNGMGTSSNCMSRIPNGMKQKL